jgi:hypothetical protein
MTDGEWLHPVARHGPAAQFKSRRKSMQDYFVGSEMIPPACPSLGARIRVCFSMHPLRQT